MNPGLIPLFILFSLLWCQPIWACAGIFRHGYGYTSTEEALIIWDPATQTEHFIRRAEFDSEQPEMGFLVPTPTRPELASFSSAVFPALTQVIQPREQTVLEFEWALLGLILKPNFIGSQDKATMSIAKAVNVIEQKQVGDYQVSVLKASDQQALLQWLKTHQYPVKAELEAWLRPYIKQGWYLSVFQFKKQTGNLGLKSVRMSFKTRTPFYPYAEPEAKEYPGRELRLFLLSPQAMVGAYAKEKPDFVWKQDMWVGSGLEGSIGHSAKIFSAAVTEGDLKGWPAELQKFVSPQATATDKAKSLWLSAWFDMSSLRPAHSKEEKDLSELFFYSYTGENPTLIPIDTHEQMILIPLDMLALAAYLFFRNRKRAKKDAQAYLK